MQRMKDQQLEQIVSALLRTGVLMAGAVVILGGALFLLRHGHEHVAYSNFAGTPAIYRRPMLSFKVCCEGKLVLSFSWGCCCWSQHLWRASSCAL